MGDVDVCSKRRKFHNRMATRIEQGDGSGMLLAHWSFLCRCYALNTTIMLLTGKLCAWLGSHAGFHVANGQLLCIKYRVGYIRIGCVLGVADDPPILLLAHTQLSISNNETFSLLNHPILIVYKPSTGLGRQRVRFKHTFTMGSQHTIHE